MSMDMCMMKAIPTVFASLSMRHDPDYNSTVVLDTARRLGERIRLARKAQKRSLVDLEQACRVHRQTLARLERGDPGVSMGVALTVLEALRKLSDVELVVSQPGMASSRPAALPPLERDF
jgi:DNA-binding XRE family transcriptional regulator